MYVNVCYSQMLWIIICASCKTDDSWDKAIEEHGKTLAVWYLDGLWTYSEARMTAKKVSAYDMPANL